MVVHHCEISLVHNYFDSLDHEEQELCIGVAQISTNLEALEKRLTTTEDVLVCAGLWKIRARIHKKNE